MRLLQPASPFLTVLPLALLGCGGAPSSMGPSPSTGSSPPAAGDPAQGPDPGAGPASADPGAPTPPAPTPAGAALAAAFPAPVATLRLNETKDFPLAVIPSGGAAGAATITVGQLPAGITGKVTPASVPLDAGPVMVKLTLTSAPDMTAATSMPIQVTVAAGALTATASLGLTVPPELLISIAKGVSLGADKAPNLTAFGAAQIPVVFVPAGVKVTFVNNDAIAHRIHADGTDGLSHEAGNLAPNGGTYQDTLTATGVINFACHIHPNMRGTILVKQ